MRVLPAGALIFEELSNRLDLPLHVCKGGVREGVILELLAGTTTMGGARRAQT